MQACSFVANMRDVHHEFQYTASHNVFLDYRMPLEKNCSAIIAPQFSIRFFNPFIA